MDRVIHKSTILIKDMNKLFSYKYALARVTETVRFCFLHERSYAHEAGMFKIKFVKRCPNSIKSCSK